jgi:hypothetical protein
MVSWILVSLDKAEPFYGSALGFDSKYVDNGLTSTSSGVAGLSMAMISTLVILRF